MFKLCVYAPENALDAVKNAMFEAGGGVVGNYDQCVWQVLGEGQFRPLSGSHPAIGTSGKTETVSEYKLELVVDDLVLPKVLKKMLAAHPYETPAYQYWRVNESLKLP